MRRSLPPVPAGTNAEQRKGGERVTQQDEQAREIEALRDCLSKLSEASLRINENLDLDTVWGGSLTARSLKGAAWRHHL